MCWEQFVLQTLIVVILNGIIVTVIVNIFLTRFDKRLDWHYKRRGRAEGVAGFLAFRIKPRYFDGIDEREHKWKLIARYWKLALWLDDGTLEVLNELLLEEPGTVKRDVLAKIRELITGRKSDVNILVDDDDFRVS